MNEEQEMQFVAGDDGLLVQDALMDFAERNGFKVHVVTDREPVNGKHWMALERL